MKNNQGPLSGVKVLDLSIYVAGPACSSILGYLGADVIKVESAHGDPYRISGLGYGVPAQERMNPCFDQCNGFKRGICVDFRSDSGKQVLERLSTGADIIVTNYREKALKAMGMSYEAVTAVNPSVVYATFTGYGDKGPDAARPGFDATTFFARSGFALRGSYRESAPMASISASGDTISSLSLAVGVLAAYCKAKETGKGERVSSSLYSSALWVLGIPIIQAQFGHVGPFPRQAPGFIALSNDYSCKDGTWVRICGMSAERYWKLLCDALDMSEYQSDERFCTSSAQHIHIAEACALVQKHFAKFDYAEIERRLSAAEFPFERHVTLDQIPEDVQALENHFINKFTYENGTDAYVCMPPLKLDCIDDSEGQRGPYLGENTLEVLREYGFTDAEINQMRSDTAVFQCGQNNEEMLQ